MCEMIEFVRPAGIRWILALTKPFGFYHQPHPFA
jgi:hypothetical protein